MPDRVEAEAVNKWLFNKDTVDKVLAHLMTRGMTVAGGDRLGKTILFAKNQAHADFIAERFNANYPHYKGEFARVIHNKVTYAQSLIDSFSQKEKGPHIALSVDMLDTGIDIPEVVNLVFFKLVRSKTKFWQMLGRGTRLCPDLFGPGQHKQFFYLFDYCQNLEYFSQNPETTDGAGGQSLGKRLFTSRLELIGELDKRTDAAARSDRVAEPAATYGDPKTEAEVRRATGELLHAEVAAMNLDNFVVRPKRRAVEKYGEAEAWAVLSPEALTELAHEVAGLPAELDAEAEEAKRFDLLILNLQLAKVRSEPGFERLRDLVKLIEKRQRKPIYTDFEDEMGTEAGVTLPGFGEGADFAKFRAKAQAYLRAHQDHIAIQKLRMNKALTAADLAELERMLAESGAGGPDDIARAKSESQGLGLFVRSLVGMEREAAKEALAGFLSGRTFSANQIEFVNLVVNHLTEHGAMEAARLYESPFTDLTPRGPDALFTSKQLDELLAVLASVRATAVAA